MMKKHGDYEISSRGIERIIKVDDGGYTTELIMPKEIFIKAYKKWILEADKGDE